MKNAKCTFMFRKKGGSRLGERFESLDGEV